MSRGDRILLAALAAALAWAYAPGLLVAPSYDDVVGVFHNPKMLHPEELLKGFVRPSPGAPLGIPLPAYAYRPLTELSFYVNGLLAGTPEAPSLVGLRVGSLLVHLAASALVLLLARRLGPPEPAFARWAAAFFALHPMAHQAVAYLYQRSVSLEAALAFLSLLLYWRARPRFSWGALAAACLATGAKETAVTLPLALAATEWILRGPADALKPAARRLWPFLLPPLLPAAMAALSSRAEEATGYGFSPLEYLALQMPILCRYALLHAWPFPLRFYWDREVPLPGLPADLPVPAVALGAGLLLAALAWILGGPDRHRLPRLAGALFLSPLALESSVFPILDVAWSYRTYPALLGSGLLFALAVRRRPWAGAAALALLACSTRAESGFWRTRAALLERDVRSAFHVTTTWANLGWHALDPLRQPRAAEPLLARALKSGWHDIKARSGHIRALTLLGRREEALEETRRMRRDFPLHTATLWVEVQQALLRRDAVELDRLADRVQEVETLRPELLVWLAEHRTGQGRMEEAERILLAHRQAYPAFPGLWDHLGWIWLVQGRDAESEEAYRRALSLDPALPKAHYNLAQLLLKRGDSAGAAAELREALRWAPGYAKAREALARLAPAR